MSPEQEAHFRLLKLIEQHPEFSQRDLAKACGYSLGRTHYVLHALIEKGFLKANNFIKNTNKIGKTAYLLTPAGMNHRIGLTQAYIERKKAEYEALGAELRKLRQETPDAFVAVDLTQPTHKV